MIVLGVDPGSQRTGYGALDSDGRRHRLVEAGVLVPGAGLSLPQRLRHIHDGISGLIARLAPDALAVEDVFHATNTRTALVLGHVRGVVLLAGAQAGLPLHEYPPATVKLQVTGSGRAEKSQVAFMVSRLLRLETAVHAGDATDALAVALCFACVDAGSGLLSGAPARPGSVRAERGAGGRS
jgi:crossover junction endodeoxyribonuclease RuvC